MQHNFRNTNILFTFDIEVKRYHNITLVRRKFMYYFRGETDNNRWVEIGMDCSVQKMDSIIHFSKQDILTFKKKVCIIILISFIR